VRTREEDEPDHEGRVDDRATHLERGVEHDAERRARRRREAVLPQAAVDVLDVDDRVVDDLADRDREGRRG
jgi:hypothetical protein